MRELDIIYDIASRRQEAQPLLIKGIGDDCAIFSTLPGKEWLASADMLVDTVHFNRHWHPARLLGRKALAVNLSDIAAMGGTPRFVLLCLALPPDIEDSWIKEFMDGFMAMADEHGATLIGGDTVSSPNLSLSVTVLGDAPQGRAVTRSGAGVGDEIFVSGPLGSAAGGLCLLRLENTCEKAMAMQSYPHLLQQHLDPTPRVRLGRVLAESLLVTAMQDISDGIATDLSHICTASRVKGVVEQHLLPIHPQLGTMCMAEDLVAVDFQIRGGENYELLFTVKKGHGDALQRQVRAATGEDIWRIGRIEEGSGVWLRAAGTDQAVEISYQGYQHTGGHSTGS